MVLGGWVFSYKRGIPVTVVGGSRRPSTDPLRAVCKEDARREKRQNGESGNAKMVKVVYTANRLDGRLPRQSSEHSTKTMQG